MVDVVNEKVSNMLASSWMMFVASRIWHVVLTHAERESIPGGLEEARRLPQGVIGLLAQHREIPLPRAIIEAYRDIGQILPGEARYMLGMLGYVSEMPESAPLPANVQEHVLAAGLVLLNYSPFSAYWRGNLILRCVRANNAWNYLLVVARQTRNRRGIECRDFASRDSRYPSKLKSRLVEQGVLPLDFAEKIVPDGHHGQRLELRRDEIVILDAPQVNAPA